MQADQPPAIIKLQTTETHDIKYEVVEQVARLLCRQDGKDPDADWRVEGNTMMTVAAPFPTNRNWYLYRAAAEKMLRETFK